MLVVFPGPALSSKLGYLNEDPNIKVYPGVGL